MQRKPTTFSRWRMSLCIYTIFQTTAYTRIFKYSPIPQLSVNFMDIMKRIREIRIRGAALEDYLLAAVFFVVIGVTVSVGAYITSQVQVQIGTVAGTSSVAYNAAGQAVSGMNTFATWLPILAIVLVSVVIIVLLYGFLVGGAGRGGARMA